MVAALTDTPLDTHRVQPKAPAMQAEAAGQSRGLFGKDGFSFWDFLDIINPLQHIPVVSTVYRAVTGDTIDPGARIAGGTLFGGPIGMAISLVSAMVQEDTGKDPGEHALAMLGIDIGNEQSATAVAQAQAERAPPQPDRVPPELLAAMQPPPRSEPGRPELKLSIKPSETREEEDEREAAVQSEGRRRAALNPSPQSMVAPQAVSTAPQGSGYAQTDQAAAMIAARARGPQAGARSAAGPAAAAPQVIDGRTWFPVNMQGSPTRGVGAQPVTQQNVISKFGVARGASDQGAAFRSETPPSADWAEKAAAAYRKYSDMQQQRDRQRALDARY